MGDSVYFGAYARFETASKKEGVQVLGADNLSGDLYEIEFLSENGQQVAWLRNRFGKLLGFFDAKTTRDLSLCHARGWKTQALLSFTAYSENPSPGFYWGEAALICYDPNEKAFDRFVATIGSRLAEGNRPEIDLGAQGVEHVIESKGEWTPKKLLPRPQMEPGSALIKTRRSVSEKLIEQGRKGNKGCYLVSWIFLFAVIAAVFFGLKSCGLF